MVQVLALDSAGYPCEWLPLREAAHYVVKGLVVWELGETCHTLRGGTNRATGLLSTLELKPIISIRSPKHVPRPHKSPGFKRDVLLHRDKLTCAYCGQRFRETELTLDHVTPESRGGRTDYMNLVAACKPCNNRKDCKTPEEAGMPLLFVPYVPNLHEKFILANRVILADQFEFLRASVPRHSRLWS
jgi:5-methylcytosine-specific restriction endonuclease McrA